MLQPDGTLRSSWTTSATVQVEVDGTIATVTVPGGRVVICGDWVLTLAQGEDVPKPKGGGKR